MKKELIGTLNMMPKMLRYFKCTCTDWNGHVFNHDVRVNGAAQNFLTIATAYKTVFIEETHIDENDYENLIFYSI